MGDLEGSLSPCASFSLSSSSHNLCPLSLDPELWLMAEQRIQEILWIIQPALASEQKRNAVIDYIRRLIKDYYATEVFPFGSVPLKTYLPDGDIDLTILSYQHMEENLAKEVHNLLKYEEQRPNSEIKDVQYIQAQVKVIKCTVKNIPVDISFNQMEGLCTLCFLEQVDWLIGKDHLLKHSIILIKSWCFYESRILGAFHGLISTYALEILVLSIINMFHSSLPGPLAVLYKFLDYYSTFDWEKYCVSINGPVKISSLPETLADSPDNLRNEVLISPEFFQNCMDKFSVPIKAVDHRVHEFTIKFLNILDPLKDGNNLGRSVSKANFHRIKYALTYGSQRLREILMQPGVSMGTNLEEFFRNTVDRIGRGERPDVQIPVPVFGTGRAEALDLVGDYENYFSGLILGQWYHNYLLHLPDQISPRTPPSQLQWINNWDMLLRFGQCKQPIVPQRGTAVFAPRVPIWHPCMSQMCAATYGIDEMARSRGTGTYIPDVRHHPYKSLLSWIKAKNSDFPTHRRVKSSVKPEEVLDDRKGKKIDNGCHPALSPNTFNPGKEKCESSSRVNLSMDQFPLLPCHDKSVSLGNNRSCQQPISVAPLASGCSTSSNINFGSLRRPTSAPPKLGTQKQPESTDTDRTAAVPKVGKLKQKEIAE